MNKTLLFFAIIIIVIAGTLIALYFLYEKPKQQDVNVEQVKLNIYTFDKYNQTQLSTNFLVLQNGNIFYNGSTVEGGGLLLNVSINNSYTIKTFNKEGQNYYTTYKDLDFFGSNFAPQRIELLLEQPGDLNATITQDDYYIIDTLTLTSLNRDIKNVAICVKWSVNLISVTVEGFNFTLKPIEKFPKYRLYDKCYQVGTLVNNTPVIIVLSPTAYIDKTPQDFINIVIIDEDCYKNECKIDENGQDLGMQDVVIQSNLFAR